MTTLKVKKEKGDNLSVSWPVNHPKKKQIEKWLTYLSPGYIEYLLQFGRDPHCNACRDAGCENVGMGDDACRAFKFGERW